MRAMMRHTIIAAADMVCFHVERRATPLLYMPLRRSALLITFAARRYTCAVSRLRDAAKSAMPSCCARY